MSSPPSRLRALLGHLLPTSSPAPSESPPPAPPAPAPEQYDPSPESPPHKHPLSPTAFLPRAAAIEPSAPAVFHVAADGAVVRRSYGEFADRARGLAYFLRRRGARRVGVVAPNTPAFLECVFGAVAAGAALVPVNYRLKPQDVAYVLAFAVADTVVVDAEYLPLLDVFRADHPDVLVVVDNDAGAGGGPYDEAVREGLEYDRDTGARGWEYLLAESVKDEDDMLAIPFTSGTTSKPKGVVYTHRGAYLAALGNVIESGLNYHEGRCKYLWTLPMFHAVGWTFPWAVAAVRGTNLCLRKIDYPLIWHLLRTEGVTHFSAAPTVNTLLCASASAARLPQPVRVTVAASPPTARLFEQMADLNLRPVHVYGLTETYGPITKGYHLPEWDVLPTRAERFARMARQGHGFVASLPARVVKPDEAEAGVLVDVAKDGKEIGEVVFSGNICAKGYYKDPEATRKLFAGGALHSGDLAVWHPDGSIQIQDRAKDIIISGGENISSVALESILVEHPDVLEAGVVAVPDSHWGERPKAYITVKQGRSLTPDELIDWAKHQSSMSRFMIPREVEIVEELPKTSTGKITKNVLREWAKHGQRQP